MSFHCRDTAADYTGASLLVESGKPVIIAHPGVFGTQLDLLPGECCIEINNRYVWRNDWERFYGPHAGTRRFVFSSDAHQPNWLNQRIARGVGQKLNIEECILFPEFYPDSDAPSTVCV